MQHTMNTTITDTTITKISVEFNVDCSLTFVVRVDELVAVSDIDASGGGVVVGGVVVVDDVVDFKLGNAAATIVVSTDKISSLVVVTDKISSNEWTSLVSCGDG